MKVGYCPSHEVTKDTAGYKAGALGAAASTLVEVMGAEDARSILVVDVHSPINNLEPLIEYLPLKERADALAVFMYDEGFNVKDFTELSPHQKLTVEGVEDQLARHVVYIGTFLSPTSIIWISVPERGAARWPTPITLDQLSKNIEAMVPDVAAAMTAQQADILDESHEKEVP